MGSLFWLQLQIVVLMSLVTSGFSSRYSCDSHSTDSKDHHGFDELIDANMQLAVNQWVGNRTGALTQFGPIEAWDVSRVTHMWNLFKDKREFNDDISAWDVSCVTTMHGMFWGARAFNQPIGLWSTGNVINMYSMFRDAFVFNQDLFWDTSNVVEMTSMFFNARKMKGDLSLLDTSRVFAMENMFRDMTYNGDISQWDVSRLVVATSMFEGNTAFNQNIKHWEPNSLDIFGRMFFNATSFNQTLCWKLAKSQDVKSFQVFCESEADFDPDCVDEEVVYNANRRCVDALDSWIQSWVDFWAEVCAAVEDLQEFLQKCFPFLPDITCFPPDAMTPVEHVGLVAMKDLQVGDRVLTASGHYQPVYSMFHSHSNKPTPYLQIHTSHSRNGTNVRPLELTLNHMLYVVGYSNPIPAWQVALGDYLHVLEASSQNSSGSMPKSLTGTKTPKPKLAKVVEIRRIVRNGLYNPLTPDGTIVVDDIVTSAYVSFLGTEHIRLFRQASASSAVTAAQVDDVDDGWKVVSHQTFVHLLLSPYRAVCLYMPFTLCETTRPRINARSFATREEEDSDLYGRIGQNLLLFWLRQNVVFQAIIFVVLFLVFGFLNMMLNPLGLSLAIASVAIIWVYAKTSFLVEASPRKKEKMG